LDDTVRIRCSRCKSNFRDKARKLQAGYSRQCPGCEGVIYFEEGSSDQNVQKALLDAKQVRKLLRQEEEARTVGRPAFVPSR
jgi:NAD-dependent SIR2 family protein deacetylase